MNPLTVLDDLMADYLSPKSRRAVHSLILLIGIGLTIWQASDHNWEQAILALVLALYGEANRANTPVADVDKAGDTSEPDDDISYEDAGGQPFPDDPTAPTTPTSNTGTLGTTVSWSGNNQQMTPPSQVSGNPAVPTEDESTSSQ